MSSPASPVEPGTRLCLFCRREIPSDARATGMNVASAGRLLGRAPDESLALTGPTGDRRWFAHPSCATEAGQTGRRSRRAMLDSVYEKALTTPLESMTREELAKALGILEAKVVSSWASLPEDVVDRASDRPYLDSLIRDGEESEGMLRYSVRVRAIGRYLNDLGGVPLMREILHLAEELAPRTILRNVESSWDEIGDWRG